MTDEEKVALQKLIETHCAQIAEHVDSVRVFVTRHSDEGERSTMFMSTGSGNYYASRGYIESWLNIQREIDKQGADQLPDL